MAHGTRVEFEGTVYHIPYRGDRREAVFVDDAFREQFLLTLAVRQKYLPASALLRKNERDSQTERPGSRADLCRASSRLRT